MTKKKTPSYEEAATDRFIPDRQVRAELSIATMTMWRWDRDPLMAELGWPAVIRIAGGSVGRKYRSRSQLEQFKANLVQRAIAQRGGEA